jgi:hypothetical protein
MRVPEASITSRLPLLPMVFGDMICSIPETPDGDRARASPKGAADWRPRGPMLEALGRALGCTR